MNLEIGGVCTALSAADAEVEAIVRRRYAGFASDAAPDWRVAVARRPEGRVALDDVVVHPDGPAGRFLVERADFLGSVDATHRAAEVALGAVTEYALDAFLRVAHTVSLLDRGALLLHAAGLVRGGCAYVFPGRSGAGKTTVTRLSPGAELLSDESSIVDRDGYAWGTPFSGELARPGRNVAAPLRGLYFLEQADRHQLIPLRRVDALRALLPNVMFFVREPDLVARVVRIADELLARVGAFRLRFRRDAGFWDVIAGG